MRRRIARISQPMKKLLLLSALAASPNAPATAAGPPAAAAWASPDVVDALDFDNGAFLLEQSPSYGSRTNKRSAWGLTDGSDDSGWCSAQGQPRGATYVWELDATWRLDTLVLSTKGMQEQSSPGISAKAIELFVAGGDGASAGGWKTLPTTDRSSGAR